MSTPRSPPAPPDDPDHSSSCPPSPRQGGYPSSDSGGDGRCKNPDDSESSAQDDDVVAELECSSPGDELVDNSPLAVLILSQPLAWFNTTSLRKYRSSRPTEAGFKQVPGSTLWEEEGLDYCSGGLRWFDAVPCRFIHRLGRSRTLANGMHDFVPKCATGHTGRVARYSNRFKGHLGTWLYEVESREGNYLLTQPEVDAIAEHLRLEQLTGQWSDDEFRDRDRDRWPISRRRCRRDPPSPSLSPLWPGDTGSAGHSQLPCAASAAPSSLSSQRPVPTSSRKLKFEPTRQVNGVGVASKRQKGRQRGLRDWLLSGRPESEYNPYIGSDNWEAIEKRTPPRTRSSSSAGSKAVNDGKSRSGIKRKATTSGLKRAPKKKTRKGKERNTRRGKWDAAYKAMLALPLRDGLPRDDVYASSYTGKGPDRRGFDKANGAHRVRMHEFLTRHGWTLKVKSKLTRLE
jgi:hypothetical protein